MNLWPGHLRDLMFYMNWGFRYKLKHAARGYALTREQARERLEAAQNVDSESLQEFLKLRISMSDEQWEELATFVKMMRESE